MQPNVSEHQYLELAKHSEIKLERAKQTAYVCAIILSGWMVASLLQSAKPMSGVTIAPSLDGSAFGAWLCGMWATIHVYRLLDDGKTKRGIRDWLKVAALVGGAAILWALLYSDRL